MILDAFLLNSCSKAAPAALGGCGGLGQLWEALAELTVISHPSSVISHL